MSDADIFEFAVNLNKFLPALMKEFSRRMGCESNTGRITFPQFLIMQFLHQEKIPRMTDLARYMRVTTAAMTGIVERLIRSGCVEREYDPGDRRIIKIKLTPKGAELFKKASRQRQQMIISIFKQVSEQDRKDYLRILTRINDIFTKEPVSQK